MGYSYTLSNKLCCDICGKSGGVRKYKCPFGWCPPSALCPICKTEHKHLVSKVWHRKKGCEKHAIQFQKEQQLKQDLLNQGKYLRCSALGMGDGKVHVLFENQEKNCIGRYMDKTLYDAFNLGIGLTIDDFENKAKELNIPLPTVAPSDFQRQ